MESGREHACVPRRSAGCVPRSPGTEAAPAGALMSRGGGRCLAGDSRLRRERAGAGSVPAPRTLGQRYLCHLVLAVPSRAALPVPPCSPSARRTVPSPPLRRAWP